MKRSQERQPVRIESMEPRTMLDATAELNERGVFLVTGPRYAARNVSCTTSSASARLRDSE